MTEELTNPSPERLAKRIHVALPIRVTYWDGANKPCLEMACTYDISEHGARLGGLRCVKQEGDIIAVERGRSKAFCRVIWIGEPNSELRGQIGIQCLESDRTLWEAELREMEESYDPLLGNVKRPLRVGFSYGHCPSERRRHERFAIEGLAELLKTGSRGLCRKATLKNLSELGCLVSTEQPAPPGSDLKLVLNVGFYDLSVIGEVRHADLHAGMGIEFREIRKGDRQILKFLLRKLTEKQLESLFQVEI